MALSVESDLGSYLLSEITVYNKYARFIDADLNKKESWRDIVERTRNMHVHKFPALVDDINDAFAYVDSKFVMPSMRSLQFAGLAIDVNPVRIYNCAYLPICDTKAFPEIMFLLLSGCGVGYSVQNRHVLQLPIVKKANTERTRRFLIQDSIEGWADSVKALVKSHFNGTARIVFDYRGIRPKGSPLRTAGGIAPGHEGLQNSLMHIDHIFERKQSGTRMTPIEVHDVVCHIASAVLSGGIRRSAMISLFSPEDHDMFTCKTGTFYETDPQRCYSNNSVVLSRNEIDEEQFVSVWQRVFAIGTGEPGVFLTNDLDMGANPCCEISLNPFQFCNLVEVNTACVENENEFYTYCKAAAFIATLQASFTDLHYLRSSWRKNTEKEALIGVGLTGLASCRITNDMMERGADIVKKENERVAKLIGIRKAARCTTLKPSGTTSIVMNTSSGISSWYDRYYNRRLRISTCSAVYRDISSVAPFLFELDVIRPHDTAVLTLPIKASEGRVILRSEETAVQFLERVKDVYVHWIKPGHNRGINHNNVSATCNVRDDEHERVIQWLYANREYYNGITVFPHNDSESKYQQLPFESITEEDYNVQYRRLSDVKRTLLDVIDDWSKVPRTDKRSDLSLDSAAATEMDLSLEPSCSGDVCEMKSL